MRGALFGFGGDLSPTLVAVGFIVGRNIAILVFAGGLISWALAIPVYTSLQGGFAGADLDAAYAIWNQKIRYLGVGAMVVGRWNLTPGLREAVQFHHQPMGAEIDPTLCAIVSLANSLCVKLGIGPERNPDLELENEESTLMLTLAPERLSALADSVQERLSEEKALLALA